MAASSTAENLSENWDYSSSASCTAGMGISHQEPDGPDTPRRCSTATQSWSLWDSTSEAPALKQPQQPMLGSAYT
eukprot:scaffold662_cov364-Pavlova_lutheri.AAC.55